MIYSESLIKTTCQHLLLLIGFDTLIYRKYYDTPPILVGHQYHSKCVFYSVDKNKNFYLKHYGSANTLGNKSLQIIWLSRKKVRFLSLRWHLVVA
jgi:hypothetical protein